MTRELTRREAITGTASVLAIGGSASLASADTDGPADAVLDVEHDAEYPRCVYDRTDDGEWEVSMPINIHARVPGSKKALSVVEDAFTGLANVRWTCAFPDSTAKAWDRDEEALVAPDHSFRRPRPFFCGPDVSSRRRTGGRRLQSSFEDCAGRSVTSLMPVGF
ncbi:hypothetical protein OB955_19540 [Halobacteria archaeon AArc-m2/3/4]|uniref:Uncharacterized protein n=1 Tax=Natronoglomus mannanivorans TaxID=2979990 RepID=A0AAP2Z408_9EURY|nr:hypothetical protein [Halobacteria archaeon AArc-xg1-1]MCU4974917.1 hypothetical protein [Halobacteria archaeon AArc-m2/3/4]